MWPRHRCSVPGLYGSSLPLPRGQFLLFLSIHMRVASDRAAFAPVLDLP